VLLDTRRVAASPETVRRLLHRQGLVWRRPRPVPGKTDPHKAYKLRKIRELLRDLPADEAAVFEDEVDLNLNPEIGCMWMPRGEQAEVVTPGTNVKRYLAGGMSWRTGELVETVGPKRDAELFVRHLDDLRRHHRRYRKIHVICDNARFHTAAGSTRVREYLATWGDRVVLHYLPAYSPNDNPIERVWWHLHEQVTRNHRCGDIDELVKLTLAWLDEHGAFTIDGGIYRRLKAKAA
jgi:transposase